MVKSQLPIRLLRTIGLSWLAFLITGLLIRWAFPPPAVSVLIDRSYCPPAQWQPVAQQYASIYQQHQHQQLRIQQVLLFSDLAEDVRSIPLKPEEVQQLKTYGRSNLQRQEDLQQKYDRTILLTCSMTQK